ncbi:hypothetical protein PISMIDRAFT_680824 [Pisolithus microcarpus 441]|uniref:F-box domain-containing protein n=1 Tax=Pisolithus microcarpus 441 TaxID=765257 RepID=A0A0C9YBF6_9AGAM|nr:hypothetical protein BKA83DRAFT_680824 [Pisolithus microcarpus]KIK22050.1 hypothetical protein PISMIDRAFT_680824 [Pisolithus microcarpus 441]
MNELFDARAKLARLKRRESELVEELLDVHKAVAAQKLVIDELIKASTIPPINLLPNELLAQIFLLIRSEREKLAHVSRRWRAVIFDTPSIWNEIDLSCYEGCPELLKLHLERSRQSPLTVSLYSDQQPEVDIVLLHANRIHVLRIFGDAEYIIDRFASFTFPALEFLFVDLHARSADPLLSLYSRTPTLKCLQLHRLYDHPFPAGPAPGQLSTSTPHITYLSNIPFQSLTHLSLEGEMDSWRLPPDSIHFPVLESLELRSNCPMPFLEAIVAPKLEQFEFYRTLYIPPEYKAFHGPTSKFDNVRHIVFAATPGELVPFDAFDLAQEFCYVFPGVRHAKIHMQHLHPLFSPYRTVGHPHTPIDNWTRLETLEIQDLDVNKVDVHFVNWFRMRKDLGLHLKLISERRTANHNFVAPDAFKPGLYQTFQECCASVELCCVPMSSPMYLSVSANSLQLFTCPLREFDQVNPTDLVALARMCSTEPADMLRAQFWTL